MSYRLSFIALFLFSVTLGTAQENLSLSDSTFLLEEVKVDGYSYNRPPSEVPAAIALIGRSDLQRFSNTSILPALNTVPGVRMEERSPGSYRLAIRGSALRSPFGVRNVKVYWNGLPFTDAGGNTYLNLLDFNSIGNAEVIKGPGSSLYGAGTGGVLLLKSAIPKSSSVGLNTVGGSYGLAGLGMNANIKNQKSYFSLQYNHLESDGYRKHAAMERDVVQSQAAFLIKKSTLQMNLLYADLSYETPGALTLQQYQEDPRQARPTSGPNKGAEDQKAAVYNKTFYAGINHIYDWTDRWSIETGIYGSYTDFKNPAIRNYERRIEKGLGGRINAEYKTNKARINFGGEYQHGLSPIDIYNNDMGTRSTLISDDEITQRTYFAFAQAEFFLPAEFYLTLGTSLNKLQVDFTRLSTAPPVEETRNFEPVLSPRIALLKKISSKTSLYASFSKGYSPPTVQELYPSTGVFDKNLDPELGTNFELGLHGSYWNKTITVEATFYTFKLDETIVIRREEDGAEYFVNAGNTQQNGIETKLEWQPVVAKNSVLKNLKFWIAATVNDYEYQNFLTVMSTGDSVDLSEKSLTGVPSIVYGYGADLRLTAGPYLNVTGNYTSEIALNDEHSQFAESYSLLNVRLGYKHTFGKSEVDIFAGVDNAVDEKYSLGNDLNAVGGRYYNAASGRNYFFGLNFSWTLMN
jgi:iron complex outermembrane recepter protein